jgi:hypothetical protein
MKRILTLTALVSMLVLAGCATSTEEYAHRERIFDKQLAQHKEQTPTPACQIIADGTNTISISGVKSFTCYGDTKQAAAPVYVEPKSGWEVFADKALRVTEILVNPLVSLAIHKDNNVTQRHASDNAVINNGITMGTINNIATQGMSQIGAIASEGIQVGRYPIGSTVVVPTTPAPEAVPVE